MKAFFHLSVVGAMVLATSVQSFAMSSDTSMSMDGGMKMDASMMMKADTMMMDHSLSMSKMSVAAIAKKYGYTWNKDRKTLATMAGITGYTGTRAQNLIIRAYLTSDKIMMKDTMMKDNTMMNDTMPK